MLSKYTIIASLIFIMNNTNAQQSKNDFIATSMGSIFYNIKEVKGTTPIVFLHGVYFDHNLWNILRSRLDSNTTIAFDMPLHGKSRENVPSDWTMSEVADLLIEVLDSLGIEKCYAIGHSWGSMTILRASVKNPERFVSIGLGNMPIDEGTKKRRRTFTFQHSMLVFRKFYTEQAAKSLFSPTSIKTNPSLNDSLARSMKLLSNRDIKQTDKAVITHVDDGYQYIDKLSVPAIALVGKDDYVSTSPKIRTRTVLGGHVSPLESPNEFFQFIDDVISIK